MGEDAVPATTKTEARQTTVQNPESPVSQLADLILTQAVRDRASDVHVDPEPRALRIRFRVDGVLYDIAPPPKHLHPFIVSRVKVMGNMDIADSRVPQDGHFQLTVDNRVIEARVSTMPTIHGENVAVRLLDSQEMNIPLEGLGLPALMMPQVQKLIRRPHGLLVVTGPTGSGKSTTLYAMLSKARSPERHIITVEDPVERRLEQVTQIQVNEKAGLSFAGALRNVLRQDPPDALMVGEIRDNETAQLAIRATLTGHLVFSTVHTNDAPGAVTRLINIAVEPFLLSSSLIAAIGQRLARKVCAECRTSTPVPAAMRKRLAAAGVSPPPALPRGRGCTHCRQTGYRGRVAVFELMDVTPAVADLILTGATTARIRTQALRDGMTSLFEDGLRKVADGVTSLEEVFRIAEIEESQGTPRQPLELEESPP
ncbi:MAG: GspE/PulE family protein [Verrucomicrobiota bacterium]|nr:GspE/PulE family protein [Verrucomicrobiota bacterium]